MATTRLEIVLDGSAPGIQKHALSVDAFGEPLARLLQALRRIASGVVTDAMGDKRYGARSGRYAPAAKQIDVEIVAITGNSPLHLTLDVVSRSESSNPWLLEDLTDTATERFLDDLEKESAGIPRNATVRSFLGSFPEGVTAQRYLYASTTGQTRTVEIGAVDLAETPRPLPGVFEFVALVVGVGFETGKTEVRLKATNQAAATPYSATPEQVEDAIQYRNHYVRVLAVRGGGRSRLLGLWPADHILPVPDRDAAQEYIFGRWHELLRRLAQ